ncbi:MULTISPECIES: DUF393 domain-containing protein [unclassified Photobacterium]|uniref:thiol-disulfide oxidoreductase DCC family protein n=1 Tax=unclassified Photobacterium TaxID=2628852 RepID=UPI001EE124FD|nr:MULTISPECIES: DUF393 domain-containing protein [unclassified Photobacterium]MCG3863783.1 DUF393 domain-containing protein [Photobacterium sp. Ph6]MCG3875313.1 DUF393 domain-containing protein [Photobacterium sp. Ph5]
MEKMIIFYDGSCPLCIAEMKQLRQLNEHHKKLQFEDILVPDFNQRFPDISKEKASSILHGLLTTQTGDEQQLLLGLDVTYKAWNLVGKKKWLKILRLPVIRIVADKAYLFFARNRYRISYLLTGKSRCSSCSID